MPLSTLRKSLIVFSTTVTGALEGSAPGVQVNNSYGEPGATPKIHIRGVGTLVKDADQPLYIVDGTPFEGNIAELNPWRY